MIVKLRVIPGNLRFKLYCQCGEAALDITSNTHYCCISPYAPSQAGHHCEREGDLYEYNDFYDYEFGSGFEGSGDYVYNFGDLRINCKVGILKKMTEPCSDANIGWDEGCYNDYNRSDKLGPGSHYRCGGGEGAGRCVAVSDMCQGLALCPDRADVEECGSRLRCIDQQDPGTSGSLNSSEWAQHHHFCPSDKFSNTGRYEVIDRTDEQDLKVVRHEQRISEQTWSKWEFLNCTDYNGHPGLNCGDKCKINLEWCRDDQGMLDVCGDVDIRGLINAPVDGRSEVHTDGDKINSNNAQLCANHTFWEAMRTKTGLSCDQHDNDKKVMGWGRRCNGSAQHCIVPWYSVITGKPSSKLLQTCQDKSDQIFQLGSKCDVTKYLDIHTELWCGDDTEDGSSYSVKDQEICTDKTGWHGSQQGELYADPHNCQASCSQPMPNCDACTNPEYFQCTRFDVTLYYVYHLVCIISWLPGPGCVSTPSCCAMATPSASLPRTRTSSGVTWARIVSGSIGTLCRVLPPTSAPAQCIQV